MKGRRVFFDWHSWIGLNAGLLLFVVCWSGAVAVFSLELDWLADPRLRAAPTQGPMAWEAVYKGASAVKPGWTIIEVNAPRAPGYSAEALAEDPDGVWSRVYADPRTGEVLGSTSYFNVQRFFRSLHMALFIDVFPIWGIPLGYVVVGLLAVVLLASLATSLLFYSRFWRGFFKLARRKGAKVFWSDLHKLTGLWSLWFVALIVVTGIWYLAEWKVTSEPAAPAPPAAAGTVREGLPLDVLVQHAKSAKPDLEIHRLALWDRSAGMIEAHGQDGSLLVRDRAAKVWLDARDGRIIGVQRPDELSLLHRWIDTADPLHFGSFGGLWSKVVWFTFGLGLSGLCLSGAYLQAKRQARHRPHAIRRPVLAAYATTAAVLILAAWRGYAEVQGYATAGELSATPLGVVLIIATWLALTFGALTWWVRSLR